MQSGSLNLGIKMNINPFKTRDKYMLAVRKFSSFLSIAFRIDDGSVLPGGKCCNSDRWAVSIELPAAHLPRVR